MIVGCAACLTVYLDFLLNSISQHLFLAAVTSVYPPDYFFMVRGSLELGCPESAKSLAPSKALVAKIAKRSGRGVRRVHEEGPVQGIAGWMPITITSHKVDAPRMLLSQLGQSPAIGS